ncbi:MAG: autotransporter-associated beta strand repeat-containing protein, partial [Planctomycetales bacterium]|nr:autotransporter-associated beta strand repeat-containing protein [Planctomycetales bacterium]
INVTGGTMLVNYAGNGFGIGDGSLGTLDVSGGTLTVANPDVFYIGFNNNGNGVVTVHNTGVIDLGVDVVRFHHQPTASGTLNLGDGAVGGELTTGGIVRNNVPTSGTSTVNFNGGTLRAGQTNATFLQGLTLAQVRNAGANIDTNGFDITINQALLHSTLGGDAAVDGGLTKIGAGTLTLGGAGANSYTGTTTVAAGTLALNKTAGVNAIAGDGNTGTFDVLVTGGTLRHDSNEQIADSASVNMSSGAWNLNGQTETVWAFTNSGGDFTTGVGGTLIGLGNTMTWSGGTNTINADGTVMDQHFDISGGVNVVQGLAGPPVGTTSGGTLHVQSGGIGLEFTGAGTPNITLNGDATSPGRILLDGDLSVAAGYTGAGASITSGAGALQGTIDLSGGSRNFIINDSGAATIDLDVSAVIANGSVNKTGLGTMRVTADNTYAGSTTVNAGVFNLAGGSLQNNIVNVAGGTFQHDAGLNNGTEPTAGTHLTVAGGAAYNLAGGELTFGDTAANTQATGPGTSSTMQIDGAFNFTGGTLSNVSIINQSTFTQAGGDFVIGVDGGLDVNDAALVRAL